MAKARRDYAKRTTTRKSNKPLPGWLWMLGGLSLGLFVAFLIYLQPLGAGRDSGSSGARGPSSTDTRVVESPTVSPPKAPTRQQPVPVQQESARQGMQFDFYNILPELEIVIPDSELQRADSGEKHTYYLQVGSFRRGDDAEARKAELLLLNFTPSVQTVTIDGNQTWHRVRIGPFTERRRVDQASRRLQDNGIDFIMLREKS
jgi:cell division protein FtsN